MHVGALARGANPGQGRPGPRGGLAHAPQAPYSLPAAVRRLHRPICRLGGSAYAAATIGPSDIKNNAVRSRHIKDAVKNPDLGANAVGTGKVIDGSLLKKDFKHGQLPKGDTG